MPKREIGSVSAAVANCPDPTDEELQIAANAPPSGRRMVEVFRVRAIDKKEKPPLGVILLADYSCASVIYAGKESSSRSFDNQGFFVLTGPEHAVSVHNASFLFDLHDGSKHTSVADACRKLCWIVDYEQFEDDKPVNRNFETCYGHVEVTFAVLGNAVGAILQVKFLSEVGEDYTRMCGKIVARSMCFKIGSVLFNREDDDNIVVNSQELIPLSRHVLAVPLIWPLIIDVDLHTPSGDEIVKCAVVFFPDSVGSHTKKFIGEKYGVEVNVAWHA